MQQKNRTPQAYIGLVLRGICMGASDIVPGVSGGTMALILGIYEELINAIRSVGKPEFIRAVLKFNIKEALQIINFPFLAAVGSGIAIAILALAKTLEHLLHTQPILIWSFFFGLIVASVITVGRRIKNWGPVTIAMLVIGTIGAFFLVGLVPLQTPESWWFLILTGAIVICAMILPGISGSFLLVLLGKYEYVLAAVNNRDIVPILLVGIGAAFGIVAFAQVISWVFEHYEEVTLAFLTGLMIGSLRKIWPWKEDTGWLRDAAGEIFIKDGERVVTLQENLLPSFSSVDDKLALAIGLAVVGFIVVLAIERLGQTQSH